MNTNGHQFSVSLRLCVSLLLPLVSAACAESDPYKRLEHNTPTYWPNGHVMWEHVGTSEERRTYVLDEFKERWPTQFKSVQTVTIDFGPVTKTFNALLIIQRPGKFRLQGMTEQGIKIFELAHDDRGDHVVFQGEGISNQSMDSISRDICRVFLDPLPGVVETKRTFDCFFLEANSRSLTYCARMIPFAQPPWNKGRNPWFGPARLDRLVARRDDGELYRFDQYEWGPPEYRDGNPFIPHVIVLRDSGRESKSYPYKLTIKISELTVRDTPWPEKTFKP